MMGERHGDRETRRRESETDREAGDMVITNGCVVSEERGQAGLPNHELLERAELFSRRKSFQATQHHESQPVSQVRKGGLTPLLRQRTIAKLASSLAALLLFATAAFA